MLKSVAFTMVLALSAVAAFLLVASRDASAAPTAVTVYISDDVGGGNSADIRAAVDALDDNWRSAATTAGANGFHQIALSGAADDPKTIWTSGGGFSVQASNRQMTATDLATANSVGSQDGSYALSNSDTLQDSAPRPASLYNTGSQPLFWNQTGGSAATRNAVLFTFSVPIAAFGAWFGDLETRTDGNGVAGLVRLLDGNGNRISADITITTSTSPQSGCGNASVGCGNRTTKWIGFVADSATLVKQMLVVVGDEDSGGNALAERLSFIGATVALFGAEPLAVTLADFSAAQEGRVVRIVWETNSELDNRGFNLWRGVKSVGPDRQLNSALIPSQSQGSPSGFTYDWLDTADLVPGTTYYYWLEDVDVNGVVTRHGPVSVEFLAPSAVGLRAADAGATTWAAVLLALGAALAGATVALRRRA